HLTVRSRVRAGQDLIIPRAPATLLAARTERPAPTAMASRSIAAPAAVAAVNDKAVDDRDDESDPITYRVKRGDTLSSIARLFDTTVDRLKSLNRLRGTRISVGDRLTVRR
ncbi:MAG: LysM peptidoglycan-binding domain-containing protein, partial [Vicinamibacterales bacterium]